QQQNLMLSVRLYDMSGRDSFVTQVFTFIEPSSTKRILSIKELLAERSKAHGVLVSLELMNEKKQVVSDNLYWWPDEIGNYTGLQGLPPSPLMTKARQVEKGKIEVTLTNSPNNPVAFFNRITLVNASTKERILPVFYNDNYFSILPGGEKKIIIDYEASAAPLIMVEGWNVRMQEVKVQ
ncbi:MAG TPA: hypothetical protein VM187_04945, partial [Niastella sp.]|nr:hypothetical protein [Niastella sp.]